MDIFKIGLDVGSTTVKIVVLDKEDKILYSTYRRHYSDVRETVEAVFNEIKDLLEGKEVTVSATGSGGLGIAEVLNIDFRQEVIASTRAVEHYIPNTDVAIELGGEDAKITYFGKALDQRMNGTCAGGTGAFIDQMASLLKTDAQGLDELAKDYSILYPIAARCGVFAKTDIQPLINEGARPQDIAASVFQAVVNQTIGGLAQGRPIRGNVAFLGGPLHFLSQLRERFIKSLNLAPENVLAPENSNLYVALGAALLSFENKPVYFDALLDRVKKRKEIYLSEVERLEALFKNDEELEAFKLRHSREKVKRKDISKVEGPLFLGIDAGSTTSKVVLIDKDKNLIHSFYGSNEGKPLDKVVEEIKKTYEILNDKVYIAKACVTGYGEHLIKEALNVDLGEIETMPTIRHQNIFYLEWTSY